MNSGLAATITSRMFFFVLVEKLLNEFSFIAKWHKLDDDTKLFRYDKYSCHELNFFLFKKVRSAVSSRPLLISVV